MDTDLLVRGGGMAGLSAAAWSVRQGRSVVLVRVGAPRRHSDPRVFALRAAQTAAELPVGTLP